MGKLLMRFLLGPSITIPFSKALKIIRGILWFSINWEKLTMVDISSRNSKRVITGYAFPKIFIILGGILNDMKVFLNKLSIKRNMQTT
jgi:hypothetical protein